MHSPNPYQPPITNAAAQISLGINLFGLIARYIVISAMYGVCALSEQGEKYGASTASWVIAAVGLTVMLIFQAFPAAMRLAIWLCWLPFPALSLAYLFATALWPDLENKEGTITCFVSCVLISIAIGFSLFATSRKGRGTDMRTVALCWASQFVSLVAFWICSKT